MIVLIRGSVLNQRLVYSNHATWKSQSLYYPRNPHTVTATFCLPESHLNRIVVVVPRCVKSANEVIDVLGGTTAVANALGVTPTVVSNWRSRGLPPETYVALISMLRERGISAPPSLWRMHEPISDDS